MQEQGKTLRCVIKGEIIPNILDYFSKVINFLFQGLYISLAYF